MSDLGQGTAVEVATRFLSRGQLAEMLGVSTKTIDRRVDDGTVPKPDFYIGRQLRWRLTTILEWTETRRTL
jgi:predicted DNA-binding transcriptional regulator AlpA